MIENSTNSYKLITNGIIINPGESELKKNILINQGKIVDLIDDIPEGIEVIDAQDGYITPGLIDQHIHGGYDCNFNTSNEDKIKNLLVNLPKHGVTAICPTIMTDTPNNIIAQIEKISEVRRNLPEKAAKIIGINLEGPFLNPEYRGAHQEELVIKPSIENYKLIESDLIKIITIAPELDKNRKLTKYLTDKGVVVSAGHSSANKTEVTQAINAGLSLITHIFNAMSPLHHRTPGITGEALVNNSLYTEVIADYNHLHPNIIELILRSKPQDKVIFISDSLPLNQSKQKSAVFGGQKIFKQNDAAINEEGNFAGSLMFLDSITRKNINNISFSKLIKFCSQNPANLLKQDDLGTIEKGNTADIVIWDKTNLDVKLSIISGKISYSGM